MDKNLIDLLYKSFENTLTPQEKELLDSSLERSAELRLEKEQIAAMRQVIAVNGGGTFKSFFAERVMRRIHEIQKNPDMANDFFESLVYMFRRVALIGIIAVIVLFSVQLFDKDTVTHVTEQTISEMTLDDVLNEAFSTSLEDIL